jgi:hypothetical protein
MTKPDWWIGIGLVVAAIVVHGLVPRYEWRIVQGAPMIRIDRWTGSAQVGGFDTGRWVPRPAPVSILTVEPLVDVK